MNSDGEKTILLVEDEALIAMSEAMILKKYGYQVITVSTGEEAVAAVATSPQINLVLMDINLGGGLDGPQAAALILKQRDLPLIFLSSHTEREVVEKTEGITSYGYIVKHSGPIVLTTSIKMAFRLFEARMKEQEKDAALRASEKRYRDLFENAPLAIFQSTLDGKVITVNPMFARMFGYESPEEIYATVKNVTTDIFADPQRRLEIIRLRAENPELKTFENLYRRKDGSTFLGRLNMRAITDADGRVLFFEGFIEDITERKQAEESLRESEERYRLLFESAPLAINITRGTEIIYANPSYLKMFGLSLAELKGFAPLELFAPEWRPQIIENIQRRAKGLSAPNYYEVECLRRDGTRFPILMYLTRAMFADGPATVGFILDITEHKRAEEQLHYQAKLLENVSEAVVSTDNEFRIVFWNQAAERLYGWRADEVIGQAFSEVVPVEYPAADRVEVLAEFQAKGAWQGEVIQRNKDGVAFYVSSSVTVLLNQAGQPMGAVAVNRDITARKQAERFIKDIITKNPMSIQVLDKEGFTLEANPAHKLLFGSVPPAGYSMFNDLQLVQKGMGEIFDQLRKGEVVHFPDVNFNPHDSISELPDVSVWVRTIGFPLCDSHEKSERFILMHENITARKQAEEALRENEEKYRILFETMTQGVVYHTASGEITSANPAAERILGLTLEQMQGRTSMDPRWKAVREDGSEFPGETHPSMVALRTSQEVKNVVMGVFNPQVNEYRWIIVQAVPQFRLEQDVPYQVYTTFDDITARKRAETHHHLIAEAQSILLRPCQLEDIYQLVSEKVKQLIGDGITATSMLDEKHQTVRIAAHHGIDIPLEKVFSMLGFNPMQKAIPLADMTEEELKLYRSGKLEPLAEGLYALIAHLAPKPVCLIIEKLLRVQAIYTMGFIRNNEHLGGLIILARNDITPHMAAIEQLVNLATIAIERTLAETALRESESLYRALVQASPDAITLTDLKGRILACNQQTAAVHGYDSIEDMLGRNLAELFAPEELPRVMGDALQILQGGILRNIEYTLLRKDAARFTGEISTALIRDEAGMPKTFVGITRDITARKQAEETLARALAEKTTLFRELQHRVKNSFMMINSLIDLEAEQAAEPGAQAALEKLQRRIYTLANLYAKLYAGGDTQVIRLDDYLAEIAQSLVGTFTGSWQRVELRLDLDELTVNAKSASAFGLILNELITNALKYAFPGDRRGFVSARLKHERGGVVLEVADDGVGLPQGFDLAQSPGLGLKLVQMLARQLGGEAYGEHAETTRFGVWANEKYLG